MDARRADERRAPSSNGGTAPSRPTGHSRRAAAFQTLARSIHSGRYPPGSRLPSEDALARQIGASRATVRDALSRLEANGLVVRRHGSGTYVAPRAAIVSSRIDRVATLSEVIAENGMSVAIAGWGVTEEVPPGDVAFDLRLAEGEPAWAVSRTYLADGTPAAWCLAYVPILWQGRPIRRPDEPGELRWQLEQQLDVLVSHVVASIEAVPADERCATALGVDVGAPLLLNRNLNLLPDGKPVMVGLNYSVSGVVATRIVQHLTPAPALERSRGTEDRRSRPIRA